MVEKIVEDISTHSPHDHQVWLEADESDAIDNNQVYGLPMASAWELKEGYTVSTLDTPHGGLSYSSQELNEIV